jgi:rhamnosyltransferase
MLKLSACVQDYFVCGVIVTFNPDLVVFSRQLNSFLDEVDHIIIVDNNSNNIDGIKNQIRFFIKSFALDIDLICNKNNVGLGRAQNEGIKFAQTLSTTHVLLFDQDSILDSGFVNGLLQSENELMAQGLKVGAVGPIYYNEKTGEIYPISKYYGPFIERVIPTDKPIEASFLIASGCLISLEIIKKVGYMNENLFIDYIDVEWSFRAKSLGYSVFSSPSSKMKHTIGDERTSIFGRSISVHSPLRRYYLYRNSIYMIRDSKISLGYKVREITFNAMRFILFLLLSNERVKYFKYSLSGFIDGLKGIKGKCPHIYN